MNDPEIIQLLFMNTVGLSVIAETLRSAAIFLLTSNGNSRKMSSYRQCFLFVQGTGLQTVINRFGLNYDGDKIRENFNYFLNRLDGDERVDFLHRLSSQG